MDNYEQYMVPQPNDDFDKLLIRIRELSGLNFPNMAVREVPNSLTKETKNRLLKMDVEEVRKILFAAIAQIDDGSSEPLDALVNQQLLNGNKWRKWGDK